MRLNSNSPNNSFSRKYPFILLCTLCIIVGFFLGWKNVPGFLKANFILLNEERMIDALMEENNLETIQLDISFKNLQKIETKRKQAINYQRLISSDSDFVKAQINFNGMSSRCRIRLKGDLPDHWIGR